MVKVVYIFGNGGHAGVLASIWAEDGFSVRLVSQIPQSDAIGEEDFFKDIAKYRRDPICIGIGDNRIRERIFARLESCDIEVARSISKSAIVAPGVELEPGVVVAPGAVIMTGTKLGKNVIINTRSSVDHNCLIGAQSQLTANVTIGGDVIAGKRCFFGISSSVLPQLEVGNDSSIMAGSVVVKKVEANAVVGGNPARLIKIKEDIPEIV